MSTIDIYDIASGDWFSQPTKDGPGQLTRGCAVVATAQDSSSFNIYYYGGYDGLSPANPFNDDVWVLSLPSFTWTNVAKGNGPGRAGHKCFMPYPDRMMAIGGYTTKVGLAPTCLRETIRVFDVNTAQWLTEYNPRDYTNYTVPDAVVKKIGGTATGDAKLKAPSGGWEEKGLGDIFNTKYPTDKIKVYWPYAVAPSTNNTNPSVPTKNDEGGGSGVPAFLPPVLGVVLGLMFLTMIAVLVLLWRRRKLLRSGGRGGMSDAGTEDTNGNRIMNWMRGQTSEAKAPTVATSDYNPATPDADSSVDYPPAAPQPNMAEVMGRPIYHPVELMGTFALSVCFSLPSILTILGASRYIPTRRTPRHRSEPVRCHQPVLAPGRKPRQRLAQQPIRLLPHITDGPRKHLVPLLQRHWWTTPSRDLTIRLPSRL